MNENNIFIKEKHPDLFTKGFTLLGLMLASLFCAFAPLLINSLKNNKKDFFIVGGLLFFVFLALFVRLILKEFHPSNLLILKSGGFVDNKNVGQDILIPWTNVASVKLMGDQEMPYLGITLDNSDIVMAKMKKRAVDEMRDNIDDNLPHILIAQNEIYTPLSELKDTFIKFIREARVLDRETPQKAKNNPFSTDDVLRAFGKLPADTTEEDESKDENAANVNTEQIDKKLDTIISDVVLDKKETEVEEHLDIELHTDDKKNTTVFDFPDSFYAIFSGNENAEDITEEIAEDNETLTVQEDTCTETNDATVAKIDEQSVNTEEYSSDLSEEINEFLSNVKFSKITEINKILNDPDAGYSASNEETVQSTEPNSTSTEIVQDVSNDSTTTEHDNIPTNESSTHGVDDGVTKLNVEKDVHIEFPADDFIESKTSSDDITFENLFLETKLFDNEGDASDSENQ